MDKDGGLSERERQDAGREADHQARRTRYDGGAIPREETSEPEPKPKPKSRSRAKPKK